MAPDRIFRRIAPLARRLVSTLLLAFLALPASIQEKPPPAGLEAAIFAGGCFWCMEPPFDVLPGVVSTTSGYTAGKTRNPTYQEVSAGRTGHTEAVRVVFDPSKVTYAKLLEVFWRNIDPTVKDRQFCDDGSQYRSGIYTLSAEQKKLAEDSKAALEKTKPFKAPIVTEIQPAADFWAAEEYHQDYYKKNPVRYKVYRTGCGRDARLQELWGKQAGK
jgi:peptide-methionine (S)-S-oxide reductase